MDHIYSHNLSPFRTPLSLKKENESGKLILKRTSFFLFVSLLWPFFNLRRSYGEGRKGLMGTIYQL